MFSFFEMGGGAEAVIAHHDEEKQATGVRAGRGFPLGRMDCGAAEEGGGGSLSCFVALVGHWDAWGLMATHHGCGEGSCRGGERTNLHGLVRQGHRTGEAGGDSGEPGLLCDVGQRRGAGAGGGVGVLKDATFSRV